MAQVQEPPATLTGKMLFVGVVNSAPTFSILDKDHNLWHTNILIRERT
jgi:hypothetical protein